jgi:hypothetical protein
MTDVSDVCDELVSVISGIAYPNGTGNASAVGAPVRIYQGWPIPTQLDADLKSGICHVSVYPRPEESNSTRYTRDWEEASLQTPTLTLAIAGQTVTVGGTIPPASNPHNLVVIANGAPFVYSPLTTDTLTSIAAALAALIAATIAGTSSSGAVVTLPSSARLTAVRIGVTGTSMQEVRRQERLIQIGILADSPAHRKSIATPVDLSLAAMTFLTMPDSTAVRLRYKGSPVTDQFEKSMIFRRDLMYDVEFGTFQTETDTQITEGQTNISALPAGVPPAQPLATVFY